MTLGGRKATGAALSVVLMVALAITLIPTPVAGTTGTLTITTDTTLTEDHFGNIIIAADSVTLDCAGYNVTGPGSGSGIFLDGRTGATVKNCILTNFTNGFFIISSSNNTFQENTVVGPGTYGFFHSGSSRNILQNNTANGGFHLGFGFFRSSMSSSNENILQNNTANDNTFGFGTQRSFGSTFQGNTANGNVKRGFNLASTSNNTMIGNTAIGNGDGFLISNPDSFGNVLTNNTAIGNVVGSIYPTGAGFLLFSTPRNTITENKAIGNGVGIHLVGSSDNTVFHNNIIDNTVQAVDSNPSANDWHRPVLEEGNFWSDYTGADDGSGTGKHAIAGDGIGDTLIPHPGPGFDNYPLIDNTPPATTASQSGTSGQAGWFISPVVVALAAVDDLSGTASTSFRIDGGASQEYTSPFTVSDGIHTVEYFSTDNAGNEETVNSLDVKIDTTPPSLSIPSPAAGAFLATSDIEVTWSSSDATSGIDRFKVVLDDGTLVVLPATATSHTFTGLDDGSHTIAVKAFDVAGNSQLESVGITVDTTLPTLSITSPVSGAIGASSSIEVTWAAADATSGIDHFEVTLDGGPPAVLPATATSHTFTGVADGSHTVEVIAFDLAGNSQTTSSGLTVDTTPPTLSISSPAVGGFLGAADVEVTWAAADATSGIDRFEVVLDDGTPVVLPATATSHTFPGAADGSHIVAVTAFDVAGNSVIHTVDLTVDTNILSLTGPYGSGPLIGTSVGIIAAALAAALLLIRRGRAKGKSQT